MGLMKWLGWVPLSEYNSIADRQQDLLDTISRQSDEVARLKADLAVTAEHHDEVAVMLNEAMETATNAVGFVAILDAAKKKLERRLAVEID